MPSSNFPVTAVQQSRLSRVDFDQLGFGAIFSDHMFSMSYQNGEWINPEIQPYQPIALEPGVSMLHYGQTVFDGYKAFRGVDGEVRIFRPDMNAKRLHDSCRRLCIPIMDAAELSDIMIQATRQLIELDQDWIPRQLGQSLYVRPLIIGTEATLEVRAANSYRFLIMTSPVGSYFTNLGKGVSLRVEDRFTRAASIGGLGAAKTAANYAGGKVITPPLGGSILPGVVRNSVLTLLEDWGQPAEERRIAIDEVVQAFRAGEVEEVFGAGTAAVICPVASIGYQGEVFKLAATSPGELTQRLYDEITGIQYGKLPDPHGWNVRVALPAGGA
jgi:branched-chain amino acid aminotransferase